jgi:AAA domain, putative AbiEii toxin, Type IV TA system
MNEHAALPVYVFPGRRLAIEDYRPIIKSTVGGAEVEYSAQTMSDGERAAIYLAGRVFRARAGVLVVDEPETHLHSLLATRFWDALEASRPDVRFVYITHDLTFARSRREARYVLASPMDGLRPVDIAEGLTDDVAEILLGAASLSFYARRVVFCEGEIGDRDETLYGAWFNDRDTVVRAVGSSEMVQRCIAAVAGGWLVGNLRAVGVIDRDFHPAELLAALPTGTVALKVHEVESLYCLPGVVSAVAQHLHRPYDAASYLERLRASVNDAERHKVILRPRAPLGARGARFGASRVNPRP